MSSTSKRLTKHEDSVGQVEIRERLQSLEDERQKLMKKLRATPHQEGLANFFPAEIPVHSPVRGGLSPCVLSRTLFNSHCFLQYPAHPCAVLSKI